MQDTYTAYKEETIEINLFDLFWSILRNWRFILVMIVTISLVLGGYGAYKEYQHLTDKDFIKEQQEAYKEEKDDYEQKKRQLQKKLDNLEEDLSLQQYYEENSIMLLFDKYNIFVQTISYYINTGYEIAPDLFYQNPNYTSVITNSYQAAIDRIDLDATIATKENPNLTTRNPIGGSKKLLNTSTDPGNGLLIIVIYGDTEERVQKIYSEVQRVISEQKVLLNKVIGEHSIEILSEKRYSDIDIDFGNIQESFDSKTESIIKGIEETKQALDELKEPKNDIPTKISVIKQGIKFSVIGAIVGLILSGGVVLLKLVLQDKVYSADDIRRRYSAPVLGAYSYNDRKQKNIDKFLAKKLGVSTTKPKEEQIRFIASNILFYLSDNKQVLLIGNSDLEKLVSLRDQLLSLIPELEIEIAGNVNDNPEAITALSKKKAVICVEDWGKTRHKEIRYEMNMINASGNENLGYILMN